MQGQGDQKKKYCRAGAIKKISSSLKILQTPPPPPPIKNQMVHHPEKELIICLYTIRINNVVTFDIFEMDTHEFLLSVGLQDGIPYAL